MARELYPQTNRDETFAQTIAFLLAFAERKRALGDDWSADKLCSLAAHNMVDRYLHKN